MYIEAASYMVTYTADSAMKLYLPLIAMSMPYSCSSCYGNQSFSYRLNMVWLSHIFFQAVQIAVSNMQYRTYRMKPSQKQVNKSLPSSISTSTPCKRKAVPPSKKGSFLFVQGSDISYTYTHNVRHPVKKEKCKKWIFWKCAFVNNTTTCRKKWVNLCGQIMYVTAVVALYILSDAFKSDATPPPRGPHRWGSCRMGVEICV